MHHRHAATTTEVVADTPHMSALTDKTVQAGADVMGVMEGGSTEERVKMMRGMDALQRSSLCIIGMPPPLQR